MTPDHKPDPFEQSVHRVLRDLPSRRAPRSLESRVLAELSRRAALPWWRKSFVHWPVAARLLFVVVSAALIRVALLLGTWVMSGFDPARARALVATPTSWFEAAQTALQALGQLVEVLVGNLPPLWLYGSAAVFAVMYATFFGLGAAAYKALRHS